MSLEIPFATAAALGGQAGIAAAVATFKAALTAHAKTVGIPKPVAHPLVESIVYQHAGVFVILDPEPEDPPAELTRIAKNAIWERATDDEAEQMEMVLAAQPVRIRRIYEGATHIDQAHELYALLNAAMTQLFGEDRAAELLAPTD
ncbi:hypothetical protein N8A98_22275 [Devosia neptuniae]|uniref:Uncharacterized protein n=1 Tax=Devosia neptuniae TaxID=191302 RepID=A0ABY6CCE5_9HYPH|nr:hypothetical protein [Devosia neptuniae]UXN69900.1 hypothetical protein N8A98_22275 [Devosia neptuniae]